MSAAVLISRLSYLVRDLESSIADLKNVQCTKEELSALDVLGANLADALTAVQEKTGSHRPHGKDQAWTASAKLRSHARSTILSLTTHGKLDRPLVFRRNIALIFAGPKVSEFDSGEVKTRKLATRQRCERIRKLSPDGVVAWAISYTPTTWAAGSMAKDIFECLIDHIEPDGVLNWPAVTEETAQKVRADEETVQNSVGFSDFIQGEYIDRMQNGRLSYVIAILDPSSRSQLRHKKRRRSDNEDQETIRERK
jgi:hypothetical protein